MKRKKQAVIKHISKSQDNNVLIKEISDTDYISQVILAAINNNTDDKGLTDCIGVNNDLQYAIDQLKRAADSLDNI